MQREEQFTVTNRTRVLTVVRHPVGGIRTYLKYTYGHLDPSKYAFTILTVKDPEASLLEQELSQHDVCVIRVSDKCAVLSILRTAFALLLREGFDLIHSQGFTAGVVVVLANLVRRCPHIITPHEMFRKEHFRDRFGVLKQWCLSFLLSHADIIQLVSHDAKENLQEYMPEVSKRGTRLIVIPNGIEVDRVLANTEGNDDSLRQQCGLDKSICIFGFLGRFMPEKGFDYLIDAAEELSRDPQLEGRFKIVAVNDGAFIREYKATIKTRKLEGYFVFAGFTPNVSPILRELTALVIPSLSEAGPLLPMEALVAGCPILAFSCPGLREVLRNTPAVVVGARDSHGLAHAMQEMIGMPDVRKKESGKFVKVARERFDCRTTAAKLDLVFDAVLRDEALGTIENGLGRLKKTNAG